MWAMYPRNLIFRSCKRFCSSAAAGKDHSGNQSKLSIAHFHGPKTNSIQNAGDFFEEKVAKYEHRDAFRDVPQNIRWTFLELKDHMAALGNGFYGWGLTMKPGECLLSLLPNEAEYLVTLLASAKTGTVFVPLNPSFSVETGLSDVLNTLKPKALIFNPKTHPMKAFHRLFQDEIDSWEPGMPFTSINYPFLKRILQTSTKFERSMITFKDVLHYNRSPDLLYSSLSPLLDGTYKLGPSSTMMGTVFFESIRKHFPTTLPFSSPCLSSSEKQKPISVGFYSHKHIISLAQFVSECLGFTSSDRVCVSLPLDSPFAISTGVWSCIASGSLMIFPSKTFVVNDAYKVISEEMCSVFVALPEQLEIFLQHISSLRELSSSSPPSAKQSDLSSLRQVLIVATNEVSESLKRRALDDLRLQSLAVLDVREGILWHTTSSGPEANIRKERGFLLPHLQARVVDANDRTVKVNVLGELQVSASLEEDKYQSGKHRVVEWTKIGQKVTMDELGDLYRNVNHV